MDDIDILMAVYNGQRYVGEQIESILNQTYFNWRLIIQDDCSTDGTLSVVEEYARRFPEKLVLRRRKKNSGAADKNFYSMLPLVQSDYVMFCDHDDVWLPDKVEKTLKKMKELERRGADRPLLVHTDLRVVNEQLQSLGDSMFRMQRLNPAPSFPQLVVQNSVTGCTVMINRTLLQAAGKPPERAVMHDWWFALIASALGEIGFVKEPTILYRQHGGNEVGAKNASSLQYNVKRLKAKDKARQVLLDTCIQAQEFYARFGALLPDWEKRLLQAYGELPQISKLQRIAVLCKYGLWKQGVARKLGQLLFV